MLLFVLSAWLIVGVSIAAAQEITVTEPHRWANASISTYDFGSWIFKGFYSKVFRSFRTHSFLTVLFVPPSSLLGGFL